MNSKKSTIIIFAIFVALVVMLFMCSCAIQKGYLINTKFDKDLKKTEETKIYKEYDGALPWSPKDHVLDLEFSVLNF